MRSAQLTIAALLVVVALAGCVNSAAEKSEPGIPDGYDGAIDLLTGEPFAVWTGDRTRFTITTFGSSSCAPVPTSLESPDTSTMSVTFVPASALICTADMAATTHTFTTPANVDTGAPVTVHVLFTDSAGYDLELD